MIHWSCIFGLFSQMEELGRICDICGHSDESRPAISEYFDKEAGSK